MIEFNISGPSTQNLASLTFTGGCTWVIFKNIKNPYKDKHETLDLVNWVRQMVRLGASRQTVVTILRNIKQNPGESVVLARVMAQRQQSLHGQTINIKRWENYSRTLSSDVTRQANGQWMMRPAVTIGKGQWRKEGKNWWDYISGKYGGRKERSVDKNRAKQETEKTLASAESRNLKRKKK